MAIKIFGQIHTQSDENFYIKLPARPVRRAGEHKIIKINT